MQLFLPYHLDDDLKPTGFQTFEQYYKSGQCSINGIVQNVKTIVDMNRHNFEKEGQDIVNAEKLFNDTGVLEDAWCEMCPEQQLEQLECEQEVRQQEQVGDDHVDIPDLAPGSEGSN